jgi:TPR repeat protein
MKWYRLAAEQNDPEGESNLGAMYLDGRAVKTDFSAAFELFHKAAEQGYAVAQNNLALMYANGQGVTRDYILAYAWLDLAAEQIPASGQLRAGSERK